MSIWGFAFWTITCLIFVGLGVWSFISKKAVGFWAGVEPPKVKDVKKYNRTVGILWFIYAGLMDMMGIPLIFLDQNSAGFIPVILGSVAVTIGLVAAYVMIEKKYKA